MNKDELNLHQIKKIVQYHINNENKFSSTELVIEDEKTMEFPWGWVFFYQSEEYLRKGDRLKKIGGNAPVIFDRKTKEIHFTGTRLPIKYYIELYEEHRDSPKRFHEVALSYVPDEWKE